LVMIQKKIEVLYSSIGCEV